MPRTNAHSPQSISPGSGRLTRVSADPAPLFVYGTLLFPDVVGVLIGRDPTRTPTTIPGWRIVALPDVVYPGLIPDQAGTATGELLTDLTPAGWLVLDAFEDPRYDLTEVTSSDGHTAYAYADSAGELHDAPEWDKHRFTNAHLPAYLERCAAWRRRYDVTTA